jgi:capsular polysaccharide export protein
LTPTSDIAAKTPAWVCAPGVLKVPFLDVFLNDYDLRRLPGDQVQAVLGWGLKPTAAAVIPPPEIEKFREVVNVAALPVVF